MIIDHISLQFVLALLAFCICAVLVAGWAITRSDGFLATGAIGLGLLFAGVLLFLLYLNGPRPFLALPAFSLILSSLAVVEGAGWQFRTGRPPQKRIAAGAGLSICAIAPFFLAGTDGLGIILVNVLACAFLCSAGIQHWRCRQEAPVLIRILVSLYVLVGLSFLLCAVVIAFESPIYRVRKPNNWAENLNVLLCIVGVGGIGAISLALNQSRLVRLLQVDAYTDPLTGLKNRRILLETHGRGKLPVGTAVAVFDLDRFKTINDQHGHAAGDAVLRTFGHLLADHEDGDSTVARTGGEEFVMVIRNISSGPAQAKVEQIREAFSRSVTVTAEGPLCCTVSVGLSFATHSKWSLSAVMHEADTALYQAKRSGRNRVVVSGLPAVA